MTKEEFEKQYAKNSGIPLERLKALGLQGEPCDCDYEGCQGWQTVFPQKQEDDLKPKGE
jgi:hypothetical protein